MSGANTKVTEALINRLEIAFQNGLNISQACLQVGISRETYYDHMKDEAFAARMSHAQEYVSIKARQNIVDVVDKGNIEQSRWWLERKDPEFKPKSDVTSDNKPIPILGAVNVHENDSPPTDSAADQADQSSPGGDISGQDNSDPAVSDPIRTDETNVD